MCGIAGIISLKRDEQKTNIERKSRLSHMLNSIRDRGPDDFGVDEGVGYAVGSVRLKIVGHEQGKQPVKEGRSVIVFNGEIYNYEDLCKRNSIKNVYSDTYLLFRLLEKNSIDILPELNGMFAFCYITADSIYLTRDRFGKKPLFYTVRNDTLYFSSEMKSFLDIIDFNMELSETYMSLETEIQEKTIFKSIFQIEAGAYLKIDRKTKQIKKIQHYNITPQDHGSKSEKQLIEELRHLVTDAVRLRTDTDKPYAVYASGGIDSSIVALLAKPKYIFSFLPKSKLTSKEEQYIDILASEMKQSQIIKVSSKESSFLKDFIDMVYINEGPTTTLGAFAQYCLAREVKNNSIRIALSGIGADEFFNGYVRHAVATLNASHFDSSLFKEYGTLVEKSKVLKMTTSPDVAYGNLINRSTIDNEAHKPMLSTLFTKFKSPLTAISVADARLTLPPLLHADDYLNMAFSIESRSPFMDYRIVEFALGLPEMKKIHIDNNTNEIYTKYLLRKTFKDILPEQIYQRKDKVGLTSNVLDLLRENMRYVFEVSYEILSTAFPDHSYLITPKDLLRQYSRWEYQICQLAITYLLFTKRYSKEEVYEYYTMRQAGINSTLEENVSKKIVPEISTHQ